MRLGRSPRHLINGMVHPLSDEVAGPMRQTGSAHTTAAWTCRDSARREHSADKSRCGGTRAYLDLGLGLGLGLSYRLAC